MHFICYSAFVNNGYLRTSAFFPVRTVKSDDWVDAQADQSLHRRHCHMCRFCHAEVQDQNYKLLWHNMR